MRQLHVPISAWTKQHRRRWLREKIRRMQRKLHPLEGIVAMCALVFVLALSVGFAQAGEPRAEIRKIALRSASALVQDAETGEVVYGKNAER
jgi:D-alanyl-D-alanine carboxypeptidase